MLGKRVSAFKSEGFFDSLMNYKDITREWKRNLKKGKTEPCVFSC